MDGPIFTAAKHTKNTTKAKTTSSLSDLAHTQPRPDHSQAADRSLRSFSPHRQPKKVCDFGFWRS